MFTPEDLEVLKMIYHLVKEQGMTIAGAKKALRARRAASSVGDGLAREVALLEQLQQIRALLVEVRDGLGADVVEEVEEVEEVEPTVTAEPEVVETVAEAAPAEEAQRAKCQDTSAEAAKPKRQKRQKESLNPSVEERPLFPFYEQTLF